MYIGIPKAPPRIGYPGDALETSLGTHRPMLSKLDPLDISLEFEITMVIFKLISMSVGMCNNEGLMSDVWGIC